MSQRMMILGGALLLIAVVGGVVWHNLSKSSPDATVSEQPSENLKEEPKSQEEKSPSKNRMHRVTLETTKGSIVFETYDADAPKTVANFVKLSRDSFYDGLIFHRVIKGFMIQGGDPKGNGTGGPGYTFDDELDPSTESYKQGYKKGVLAMANAGPNTNGSQFFILLEDYPLPNAYTIFGKVVKGQEVVDAIGRAKTGTNDKPLEDIKIKKVTVSETQ